MESTVLVTDSASNTGHSSGVGDGARLGADSLAVLCHAYSLMDKDSYKDLYKFAVDQQRLENRLVSLRCAENRVSNSSVNSASDSGLSSGKSGSFRAAGRSAKLDNIKRAVSWRKNVIPSGYCYTRLFKDSDAQAQASRLGSWPTVAALLQTSASHFRPVAELSSFSLVGDKSAVHVEEMDGSSGTALKSLAQVAKGLRTSDGSFGALLRDKVSGGVPVGVKVTARTAVGGGSGWLAVGDEPPPCGSVVFLAGTNEKFVGPGWREELRGSGRLDRFLLASPRESGLGHLDTPLPERAAWERRMMDVADCVLFFFKAGASSSVSLMELGMYAGSGKLVVACDPGYERAESVKDLCTVKGVQVFDGVSLAIGAVERIAELRRSRRLLQEKDEAGDAELAARGCREYLELVKGVRDEVDMDRYAEFLEMCPRYRRVSPVLAAIPSVASSEVVLSSVRASTEPKVFQCDLSLLGSGVTGKVRQVLDRMFPGLVRLVHEHGVVFVATSRHQEYFGEERLKLGLELLKLCAVDITYSKCVTRYVFSPLVGE